MKITLKELRIYHYNAAVRACLDANFHATHNNPDSRTMHKAMRGREAWHNAAVVALNDVVSGDASSDAATSLHSAINVAKMITDTQRLDFVIATGATWYESAKVLCYTVGRYRIEAKGATMREAIDNAMVPK